MLPLDPTTDDRLPSAPHPREAIKLFGQDEAVSGFMKAFQSGRLHHAWILSGPQGVGKATFAYQAARFLLDPQRGDAFAVDPAHVSSRQILALSHPDLHVLRRKAENEKKPVPNEISVDLARDAIQFFSSTAGAGGYRVLIVDSADHLNRSSANALLKAIEEPPKQAVIFIVTHMIGRLLPTIRSRCRVLPFRALERPDIERILSNASENGSDHDPESLRLAVDNARGSARRGYQWLDERFAAVSSHVETLLSQLPEYDRKEVLAMSEAFGRKEGRNDFETMREVVLDWLTAQVALRAGEGAHRLAPLAEVWEKTEQAVRETERYNLDRRALALNIFNDLATATRRLKAV